MIESNGKPDGPPPDPTATTSSQYAQAEGAPPPAPSAIGTVSKVSGQVTVKHADGSQEALKSGDTVKVGDAINTGADGKVGLTFDDGSTFALGAKGHMSVDEMTLPSPQGLGGKETISVDSGSFSLSSGAIAKGYPDAMVLKTPVASVGIRGTTVAGQAAPEGSTNTISLLPDPDGTIGQVSVSTQTGTQVLSQPGATTQVSSAFSPPPPPVILSPQQIQQQYGDTLQTLPPPPSPEQLQQLQQQRQTDAETEAEAVAQQQTKNEDAATQGAAEQQAQGETGGDINAILNAFFENPGGQFGELGMTDDPFTDLAKELNALFANFDPTGLPEDPGNFDLGALIQEIDDLISELIDEQIQDLIDDFEDIAESQPVNMYFLDDEGSPFPLITRDGETDYVVGRDGLTDEVTVSGEMGLGDTFVDFTSGDGDRLTLTEASNIGWRVAGVENVNLASASGTNTFMIGSDGSVNITLAGGTGVDSISSGTITQAPHLLSTGDQQWHISGGVLDGDNLNMGGGTDTLFLVTTGTHSATVNGVENISFAESSGVQLTLHSGVNLTSLIGSTGVDSITLADTGNALHAYNVESVIGGAGIDSLTVSGLTRAVGGDGNDTITLTSLSDFGSGDYLSGDGGTDTLRLEGTAGTVDFSTGTIQYFENMVIDTDTGSTTVSWSESQSGSWQSITGRSGETDILKMANASSNFDLTGISLTDIDEVHLGTGNDSVRFDDALGNGTSITSTLTFVDNDGTNTDTDTVTFFVQKAGSTLDVSGITLSNIESVVLQAVDDSDTGDEHEGDSAWNGASMTIVGSSAKNNISVLSGTNVITGGANDDSVSGGSGIDRVNGGQGNDILEGNGGADTLNGGMGDDTLTGGAGIDSLTGDAGNDVFRYTDSGEFGDTITSLDFNNGAGDTFLFTSASLGGLTSITAANFATTTNMGAFTFDGNDLFVFAASGGAGALWFSANGTGSDKVEVAEFTTSTGTMTYQDITIVA